MIQVGKIVNFTGSFGSGIASLSIQKPDGTIDNIPCENGPTVRALDAMFGGVIQPGHRVDVEAVVGYHVQYEVDDIGLLLSLAPAEE